MYTTLESPAQPNYSLGPPYTNYSQPPYYNYRPHYTSDILNPPASSYTGFHRADSHHQPFAYDELSKLNATFLIFNSVCSGQASHPSLYDASGSLSKNYGGIYVPSAASAALPSRFSQVCCHVKNHHHPSHSRL